MSDAAIDLTHASRSEEVLDFVGPESIAGDERHRAAPMMARDGFGCGALGCSAPIHAGMLS